MFPSFKMSPEITAIDIFQSSHTYPTINISHIGSLRLTKNTILIFKKGSTIAFCLYVWMAKLPFMR